MSILDRVTKAVGDVVDRGKKEVDQFVRIQKINGQIGDLEKTIGVSNGQIQQIKVGIGEMAVAMLQAGSLTSPEMKALLDQISEVQKQVAAFEAEIKEKRAEIEHIKSEDKPTAVSGPAIVDSPVPPSPPATVPPPPSATAPPPPPASAPPPSAATRFCSQCGARAGAGVFCSECGSKLG